MKRLFAAALFPRVRVFFAPYREFFALPDVRRTVLVTLFARMPVGLQGLALVMYLRDAYGSFKTAGTVVGVYFFAIAACAPIMGRVIDRIGPRIPLIVTGLAAPVTFALLIAAVWSKISFPVVIALSVLMGACSPPITATTRVAWRHRFATDSQRRMAFSVDSIVMELNFTMGPAIVGVLLLVTSPLVAILLTWLWVSASVPIFLRSPALNYWQHQQHSNARHWLGPLTEPRLLLVFAIIFGLTTTAGLLEVGYPAYATYVLAPAFAGVLLSLNSLGSAIGGLVFGALRVRAPIEKQFAAALALFGASMLVHWLVDSKFAFSVVAFFAGFAIAPSFAAQSMIVSRLAPARYATEAFTWAATFIVCGLGAGMALAGVLTETVHPKAPFVVGGVIMLAMAILACMLPAPAMDAEAT